MKPNEIIMKIYVTDEEVENRFEIIRIEDMDDDDYQERCDETDMSIHDIDIATVQKGDMRYCVFTSCDKWNVYLSKEQLTEDNIWEIIDMNNITSDIDDWENIQGLTSYLLDLNFKEEIKQKNIVEFLENKIRKDEAILSDAYWLDTITFYVSFAFSPEELRLFFSNKIENDEDCYLCAEYHEDDHKFVYELIFDCDRIDVANEMQSHIIDWYILEQARSF